MRNKTALTEEQRASLGREVRERNLTIVAREIDVHRASLAAVLTGTAREGTEALVAQRLAERRASLPQIRRGQ